jgi:hypothetical protein
MTLHESFYLFHIIYLYLNCLYFIIEYLTDSCGHYQVFYHIESLTRVKM